jgi:hypothetical protein
MQSRQSYLLYEQGKEQISKGKKVIYINSLRIRPPLQRNQKVKDGIQLKIVGLNNVWTH